MPFFLIPTALGVCFFVIWVFIGGMLFRDSQLAAQSERESELVPMPLGRRRARQRTKAPRPKMSRPGNQQARFAS